MKIDDLIEELEYIREQDGNIEVAYPFDTRYNAIINKLDVDNNPEGDLRVILSGNILENII